MEKIVLNIQIQSLDSELSYETEGEKDDNRMKFVDLEGDTNYILFKKEILEYYKKGEIDMKYTFDLDSVTTGHYAIMGNKFDFDIVTNELNIQDDYITIKYDLYQHNEIINKTTINIQYFYKEESQ